MDLDTVIYLAAYGTVTSLQVLIQNILNCIPKTNGAFTGLERHGGSTRMLIQEHVVLGQITLAVDMRRPSVSLAVCKRRKVKHQFQQVKTMAAPFRSLVKDYPRYLKSFELFRERSSEHQCMQDFIHNTLPDILASIGGGRSVFSVMGIGSGAGEIDLEMLAQLHLKLPHAKVINKVVEPSNDMLHKYKRTIRVSTTPDLDYINFTWNKMMASEFEKHWQEKNPGEKMDFIHMIQMLYYVKDPEATVSFFRSLLNKDGKLLIILVSGESGYGKLWTTFRKQLCNTEISQCVTTGDIKTFLDTESIPYQNYELLSQVDITECFTEGDQVGELLLDFLMEVIEFGKNVPEDLKKGVLDLLRHPDCSKEVDGRIIFNNNLGVLVVEP